MGLRHHTGIRGIASTCHVQQQSGQQTEITSNDMGAN